MKKIIIAAVAALALTACGGSEPEPTPTESSTPTPIEWSNDAYDENGNPTSQSVETPTDWDADFDYRWVQLGTETQNDICDMVNDWTQEQFIKEWGKDEDWPEDRIVAWYENASATEYCQERAETRVQTVAVECYNDDFDTRTFDVAVTAEGVDFSSVWTKGWKKRWGFLWDIPSCSTDLDVHIETVERCVAPGSVWIGNLDDDVIGWTEELVTRAEKALKVCPEHPDRKAIMAYVNEGRERITLESQGIVFKDGLHQVGQDIQPGSYYVENASGCYWERQNEAGAIIDNYFGTALRVEVYIDPSDYGFLSRDCGTWKPL